MIDIKRGDVVVFDRNLDVVGQDVVIRVYGDHLMEVVDVFTNDGKEHVKVRIPQENLEPIVTSFWIERFIRINGYCYMDEEE